MRDLISPTRDRTPAPCSGLMESKPLDLQGVLQVFLKCNCPQRLPFRSIHQQDIIYPHPLAPQSDCCLCVSHEALSCPICVQLCTFVPFFFWPSCVACGILVPRPGIEHPHTHPTVESQSPNHWTAREFPLSHFEYEKWEEFGTCHHDLRNHPFRPSSKRGFLLAQSCPTSVRR